MTINPVSTAATASAANTARQGIADNFDSFLMLLTTQLRHQNPLEPLDTNQFTQQLVQFAGVEQAISTNRNLETLNGFAAASAILGSVAFVGKEVDINGDVTLLSGGTAQWRFNAPQASGSAEFVVLDSQGVEVYRETRALDAGEGAFTWDGRTTAGGTAPNGDYRLSIQASDANGQSIVVSMASSGIVQGVDFAANEPLLIVNGRKVPFSQVTSVRAPS